MNRRDALQAIAEAISAAALTSFGRPARAEGTGTTGMGLVVYCLGHHQGAAREKDPQADLFEPLTFLEHCRKLGAGGIQAPLGIRDQEDASRLRSQAERYGMYIEGIGSPPRDEADVQRFEAQMQTAAWAGARAVRTVIIPGRRYEFFDSLEKFREFAARGRRALELAAPLAEKYRVPLAVENHKDHRAAERAELLRHISSEYVGACVDTGNNLALLEDSVEVARTLAPWAVSVHLKDQAVQEYKDGFLLADIPLGQGCIDLKTIVDVLRQANPDIRFTLELITREPLKVPCLTEPYWSTLADVSGRDLARMLRTVRAHAAETLPEVNSRPREEQVAQELANVKASLAYARDVLKI
jgi:sugar phosphate isomerase/epimerase